MEQMSDLDEKKIKSMKVTELKDTLQSFSLPTSGLKADLAARLIAHVSQFDKEEYMAEAGNHCRQHFLKCLL